MSDTLASSCSASLKEFVTSIDIFAIELAFTYNNRQRFKSFIGGIGSIITIFVILAYFLILASKIWNFEVTLKTSLVKRDLVFEPSEVYMDASIFDFAVNVNYRGSNTTVRQNIHSYMSLNLTKNYGFWENITDESRYNFTAEELKFEKCNEQAFNGDIDYLTKVKAIGNFFCPTLRNFTLKGTPSSENFSYLGITVGECRQEWLDTFQPGTICAPLEDQIKHIGDIGFFFTFMNQYFSGENQIAPIQPDYKLMSFFSSGGVSEYSFLRIGLNHAILEDSWLLPSYSSQNISYSTTRIEYQGRKLYTPYSNESPFLGLLLFLDDNVYVNKRTAFPLVQALQQIGGFTSVILILVRSLLCIGQRFLFLNKMIQTLYSYEPGFKGNKKIRKFESSSETYSMQILDKFQKLSEPGYILNNSSSRQIIVNQNNNNDRQLSKQELIEQKVQQLDMQKIPSYSFCSYLTFPLFKKLRGNRLFHTACSELNNELNIEDFIQKMRVFDLYLRITLEPYQKQILNAFAKKVKIEPAKSFMQGLSSEDLTLNECLANLIQKKSQKTNKKIAQLIGLDFKDIKVEPKQSAPNQLLITNQQFYEKNIQDNLSFSASGNPDVGISAIRQERTKLQKFAIRRKRNRSRYSPRQESAHR